MRSTQVAHGQDYSSTFSHCECKLLLETRVTGTPWWLSLQDKAWDAAQAASMYDGMPCFQWLGHVYAVRRQQCMGMQQELVVRLVSGHMSCE